MNFKVGDLVYCESYGFNGILIWCGVDIIELIFENFIETRNYRVIYINNLDFPKDTIRHATEIERLLYG